MESWTVPLSPETSSDEEERDRDSGSAKRSYECTFCKRGFTNAQALGGHMNIHRKDRAKAKQLSNQYHRSSEDYISMSASQFSTPIYGTQPPSAYYPVLAHHHHEDYHQMFYQPSESSPRTFYGGSMDDDSLSSQSSMSHHVNQELWGANLSLRFNPTGRIEDDDFRMAVSNHEDVDLELRLGHGGY